MEIMHNKGMQTTKKIAMEYDVSKESKQSETDTCKSLPRNTAERSVIQ
jgi:hypothetical protein